MKARRDVYQAIADPTRRAIISMIAGHLVITTEVMKNVLWAPAQALFESDGRTFVYVQNAETFLPHDVKLVRRSESQL